MKIAAAALLVAASLAAPATAHADDAVPTVEQVVALFAELTDPNIPAMSKGNIVTPGFSPDEAAGIDDHLHRMDAAGFLPLPFIVTDIQPAPNDFAGATLQTGGSFRQSSSPGSIVLVHQNGRWLITHDTAMTATDAFWFNAHREVRVCHPKLACVMR